MLASTRDRRELQGWVAEVAAEESRFYELGDKWSPPPAWARNKSVSHRFTEWCMVALPLLFHTCLCPLLRAAPSSRLSCLGGAAGCGCEVRCECACLSATVCGTPLAFSY